MYRYNSPAIGEDRATLGNDPSVSIAAYSIGRYPRRPQGPLGGSTHRGNVVYLHILRWPSDTIILPDIGRKIVSHKVLTGGKATVKQTEDHIEITAEEKSRDEPDTIIRIKFDKPATDVKPVTSG
jgi:hypothetical protein